MRRYYPVLFLGLLLSVVTAGSPKKHEIALLPLTAVTTVGVSASRRKPSVVKVEKTANGFTLLRNGQPYFIKGAGGETHLELLVRAGGNSIRTWGADNLESVLDQADALGLTVTIGIWLGHEQQGFRYDDPNRVAAQLEQARAYVQRYKNHPALLLWGVGNEMEGSGNNPAVWKAVNAIAKMIHTVDPNHPTMTVLAEIGGEKIKQLQTYCPDVDILGINSYGGLPTLPQRLKEKGWQRPYIVTEFGPLGQWEVAKTAWGAPIEMTSTQKAEFYLRNYAHSIAGQKGWCLGSYAFLWGWKQEVTGTWYGMLLPTAGGVERLGAADAMTFAWTGKWPTDRAPKLRSLAIEADGKPLPGNAQIAPGTRLRAVVTAGDPDGDALHAAWEVRSESSDRKQGGARESAPPAHPECLLEARGLTLDWQAPTTPGAYRLFVVLHDGKGNAATANVPFLVTARK